jgi:hypothetical protein
LIRLNGKAAVRQKGWNSGPFEEPDRWRKRLARHRGNVGLLCGRGLVAVDFDLYKPDGAVTYQILDDAGLIPADTVRAHSGGGGLHVLLRYDPERWHVGCGDLKDRALADGTRLPGGGEFKGESGYVVVAPSVHPDTGLAYIWEDGCGPGDIPVARAPEELLALLGYRITGQGPRRGPGGWETWTSGALDETSDETMAVLLEHFGAHSPIVHKDREPPWGSVTRSGKKPDGGTSATVGYVAPGVVKVWSTRWPGLDDRPYTLGELRRLAGLDPPEQIHVRQGPALELPDGYRLWREGDETVPVPVLGPAAYHGPIGDYLTLVDGETEAHPAAVGSKLLGSVGCLIGRRAQIWNGEHFHHPNLFALTVGKTSTGAKGVADRTADLLVTEIEPGFAVRHVIGGFGSGEALLDDVRDTEGDDEPVEKRRVIVEAEFARVLQVARREHNILSVIIRNAFDYAPIRHRTKAHGRITATDHHLSVDGSITPEELLTLSAELDLKNGWLNRFMFFHSHLTTVLPFGGRIDREELGRVADNVRAALDWLEEPVPVGGTHRRYNVLDDVDTTPAALRALAQVYDPWYRQIREGTAPLKDLTCRQHVHVPRLMLIFAVLDRAPSLTVEHFDAARAWNDYSVATAMRVFGAGLVGKVGQLLAAIRDAGSDGLDGTAQRKAFHDHLSGDEMTDLRAELESRHLAHTVTVPTGGRARIVSYAVTKIID